MTEGAPEGPMIVTPVRLDYQYSVSASETKYLTEIREGRLFGQRCPACQKVYMPPRSACPTDGVFLDEFVELPDKGTVTTFCIVNVPFLGQKIEPPYVAAYVLLDGADIAFQHLVQEIDAHDVNMGLRVEAVWGDEPAPTLGSIQYFRPTGEPDAAYETFKDAI